MSDSSNVKETKFSIYANKWLYSCDLIVGCEPVSEGAHYYASGDLRIGPKKGKLRAVAEFHENGSGLQFLSGTYEVQGFSILDRYYAKDKKVYYQDVDEEFEVLTDNTGGFDNLWEPLSLVIQIAVCLEEKTDRDFFVFIGGRINRIGIKYESGKSEIFRNGKSIAYVSGGPITWQVDLKKWNLSLSIKNESESRLSETPMDAP